MCVVALAGMLMLDALVHLALAQTPFGAPKRAPEPQAGGIVGWILAKQSEFYREMSATIRAAKSDGSAVWTLLAISFVTLFLLRLWGSRSQRQEENSA